MGHRLIIAILLLMQLACVPQEEVYLFSYFKGKGEGGLHLAYSEGGYHFKALNNDKALLTPAVGQDKLFRDPSIIQGPDGIFHMVWTVSWHEKGIGYASSSDLVHWSKQQYLPVMAHEPGAMNCWAPELFYDQPSGKYLIYWSTTIAGKYPETANMAEENWNHRIYYTLTEDFKTFTDTKLLLDPGFNVIDAVIFKKNDGYGLVVKDETKYPTICKDLRIATSSSLTGGYEDMSGPISDHWVEGPTITRLSDQWIVYFDRYREHSMGAVASRDLIRWDDISSQVSFPQGARHGTVIKVRKKELSRLMNLYN